MKYLQLVTVLPRELKLIDYDSDIETVSRQFFKSLYFINIMF